MSYNRKAVIKKLVSENNIFEVAKFYDEINYIAQYACLYQSLILFDFALKNGANNYTTMILNAAKTGFVYILDYFSDKIKFEKLYEKIAFFGAYKNKPEVIKWVLDRCKTVSVYNYIACGAAKAGNEQLVNKMLNLGANDINSICRYSIYSRNDQLFNKLKEKCINFYYPSLIYTAAYANRLDLIVDNQSDDVDYEVVAINAAWKGNLDIVKYCIQNFHVDLLKIAIYAAIKFRENVVKYLLENKYVLVDDLIKELEHENDDCVLNMIASLC